MKRRIVTAWAGLWLSALCIGACGAPKPAQEPATPAQAQRPTAQLAEASQGTLVDPRQAGRVVFETPGGPQPVTVELAATAKARARGLMGRETLADGSGMLFVFETLKVQTFWMRNTLISLDMIFVAGEPSGRGARVVGIVHEAEPHSTVIRAVDQPSRFVVEVPGGWARRNGVSEGVTMRFAATSQ